MESILYYSRNGKKSPFEVTIETDGKIAYINCNCELGMDRRICRHKINAIRGDREHSADSTSDATLKRLRALFGRHSTLRQHLEEKWRNLRIYADEHPDRKDEIGRKRKILGEAFANGFIINDTLSEINRFDADAWEGNRDIYVDGINARVTLTYESYDSVDTKREVNVTEVFVNNLTFYLSGYCHLRKEVRTFRIDRIHGINFHQDCSQEDKSVLLDVVFQGNPTVTT